MKNDISVTNNIDGYISYIQKELLDAYTNTGIHNTIPENIDDNLLNGISRFLSVALSDVLYYNNIPLESVSFKDMVVDFAIIDNMLEYVIPCINNIIIISGVQLLHSGDTTIMEQEV